LLSRLLSVVRPWTQHLHLANISLLIKLVTVLVILLAAKSLFSIYPKDQTKYYIKRVIGLPGDTVVIDGTKVTIKNAANPEGFDLNEPYISFRNEKEDNMTVTLKDNQYFVMGDNRLQSSDSRAWGTLPRNLIIGTPFVRLFPFTRLSVYPGDYKDNQ
jgi:signal peptidase I